jgi:outer membrane protein assembly factor BamC
MDLTRLLMSTSKYWLFVLVAFSTLNLSACSTIKSWFPDKEKDYHYHKELPALEYPPDLQPKPDRQRNSSDNSKFIKQQQASEDAKDRVNQEQPDDAEISNNLATVRMVEYDDGSVRIQIDSSLKRAWPIVGKALSRNAIEITDRNRSEAVYFVQYDPEVEKYEDGSILDEIDFFFGDDPRQEKEYHIRLAEDKNLTEVMVADEKDQPLTEGDGIKLLNLLYETIKADQKKKPEK